MYDYKILYLFDNVRFSQSTSEETARCLPYRLRFE